MTGVAMGSVDDYLDILIDHPFIVVFVSSFIEAMGIPFPSRVILILTPAFLLTERGLAGLVAVATIGALLGDHVPYLAGRFAGTRMLTLYCKVTLGSALCVEKTLGYFRRYRSLALLASRFSTGVRIFASACAGCGHVTYARFLMLDAIGTVVYTVLCVAIGNLIGDRAVEFLTHDRRRWLFVGAVVVGFASVMGYRMWRKLRHGAAKATALTTEPRPVA